MPEQPTAKIDADRESELKALKERQARELEELQRRQREEVEKVEQGGPKEPREPEEKDRTFEIKIDRTQFKVSEPVLTGAQLRQLPNPPIGPDRDLFEVVPGGSDKKITDNEPVKMRNGLRFFTAPAQINPGAN